MGNSIRVTYELTVVVSGGFKPVFSTKQEQSQEQWQERSDNFFHFWRFGRL